MGKLKLTGLIIVFIFIIIQFIPYERTNPPVTGEIQMPERVQVIIQRSCYDCHSNQTIWPWYSHVAPVSWLVIGDVHDGREHMNFSEWEGYNAKKKAKLKEEIPEEIEKGDMPLFRYLIIHTHAKLTQADIQVIKAWAQESPDQESGEME
jgi:hypothetical protein